MFPGMAGRLATPDDALVRGVLVRKSERWRAESGRGSAARDRPQCGDEAATAKQAAGRR